VLRDFVSENPGYCGADEGDGINGDLEYDMSTCVSIQFMKDLQSCTVPGQCSCSQGL
jgi:hypothetical protein